MTLFRQVERSPRKRPWSHFRDHEDRDYDVVIYCATGVVGSRAAEYLAGYARRDNLRWAIGGGDRHKLEAMRARLAGAAPADLLIADTTDQSAVDAVVARTRVLLNVAGPFALYGNAIVDACVRLRTHYVDIAGETVWVKSLIDRYHEKAAAEGTRVIPFSGFDSVLSDLASYDAVGFGFHVATFRRAD